jgi:hypothetical protein
MQTFLGGINTGLDVGLGAAHRRHCRTLADQVGRTPAAVNDEHMAIDEGRIVRAQKRHCTGDIFGAAHAREGDGVDHQAPKSRLLEPVFD